MPAPKLTKPVAIVYVTDNQEAGVYLVRSPFIAEIAGKVMIVGTGAKWGKATWTEDLEVWIDWRSVSSIVQFDSVEQCQERLRFPRP